MIRTGLSLAAIAWWLGTAIVLAQSAAPRFEVVSIRRHATPEASGGSRTLPDGTSVITNQTIEPLLRRASPVPVRTVVGMPDWVKYERYDITAKPPAGRPLSNGRK